MSGNQFTDRTVVITGASSGLGRATAVEFARRGARLGLVARDRDGLEALAAALRVRGCGVEVCVADVADPEAVKTAARQVAERFGGIDVWVNNAAVAVYGELDQVPLVEQRRVMDVNFFGQVHGVRAALPFLESSSFGGRIVGILSVLSEAAVPLQGAYTASKHALFGMYKCLREELIHRHSRVRVATIFIPSLATPLFDHAKTYMGYRPKPVGPVYRPEGYARLVVDEAWRPHFKSAHGGQPRLGLFFFRNFLGLSNVFQGKTAYRGQRSPEPKGVAGGDNLFAPMPGYFSVRGSTPPTKRIEGIETAVRALGYAAGLAGALALLRAGRARGQLSKGEAA
ncbi:MAG: SDR family oxidoreductase [Oligoflexia bacterium]|nr:SDR family oxidoreductase [Oligoflexia bacterium]